MIRTLLSPAVLSLILAAAAPVAAAAQVTGEEPRPQLSPAEQGRLVGVLATEQEVREWQDLATAEERLAFLERFWEVRDPTPGTPENEIRDLFMERAARAARMFTEGDVPGWATDRGRALLVYGLPDQQERRTTDEEPELRWSWDDAPGSVTIRFAPDGAGGWVLPEEADVDLDWEAFADNARERIRLPVARPDYEPPDDEERAAEDEEEGATAGEVEAPGVEAEEAAEPPPMSPEAVAWLAMLRDGEVRRDFDLDQRLYFFPAPDGTFMLVGFSAGPEGLTFEPVEIEDEDEDDGEEEADGEEDDGEEDESGEDGDGTEDDDAEGADEPEVVNAVEERASLRVFGGVLGASGGEARLVHQFNIPFTMTRPIAVDGEADAEASAEPTAGTSGPEATGDSGDDAPADAAESAAAGASVDTPVDATEADPEELGDDTFVRSFGVTLSPGTYRLAWGVIDSGSESMSLADEVIRVPDFATGELDLSSIILALPPHSRSSEEISVAEVYSGLRLGSSLMDVSMDRVFRRSDRFEVVFIVSGWQEAEGTPGRPRLEVGYRVLVIEADGSRASIARLPVQELSFHAVGQEIPLSQIEQVEAGASYELEITVRDLVAGTELVEIVPFSVAPESPASTE